MLAGIQAVADITPQVQTGPLLAQPSSVHVAPGCSDHVWRDASPDDTVLDALALLGDKHLMCPVCSDAVRSDYSVNTSHYNTQYTHSILVYISSLKSSFKLLI